jgi:hypothetical protein
MEDGVTTPGVGWGNTTTTRVYRHMAWTGQVAMILLG